MPALFIISLFNKIPTIQIVIIFIGKFADRVIIMSLTLLAGLFKPLLMVFFDLIDNSFAWNNVIFGCIQIIKGYKNIEYQNLLHLT